MGLHHDDIFLLSLPACITVVACNASKVALLFKQAESCPSLRLIIKLGGAVSEEEKEKAAQIGISIHSIQEVEVRREGVRMGGGRDGGGEGGMGGGGGRSDGQTGGQMDLWFPCFELATRHVDRESNRLLLQDKANLHIAFYGVLWVVWTSELLILSQDMGRENPADRVVS